MNELGPWICRDTFELSVYKAEMAARGIAYNPTQGRRGKMTAATVKPAQPLASTPTRSSETSAPFLDLEPFRDPDKMLQLTRPRDPLPSQTMNESEMRRTQISKEEAEEETKNEYRNMKMIEKLHDMRIADGYRFHGKSCGSRVAEA
jgi:hypothetical protein